jgi:hypothetical protein
MARPRKYEELAASYTLHVNPKYIFALKLVCRTGDTDSEANVLEAAIEALASRMKISRHWTELWSASPGVAWLNAYALPEYRPIQKELGRVEFITAHAQFFYKDKARSVPNAENATILWDDVDGLAKEWLSTRKTNYWGTAKKMAATLKKAGLSVPSFG